MVVYTEKFKSQLTERLRREINQAALTKSIDATDEIEQKLSLHGGKKEKVNLLNQELIKSVDKLKSLPYHEHFTSTNPLNIILPEANFIKPGELWQIIPEIVDIRIQSFKMNPE